MKRLPIQRRSDRSLVPLAIASFLATSAASASPNYPATIEEALSMPCAPTCELCHLTAIGRGGNATQPFAVAMVEAGLASNDPDLLTSLLTSLSTDPNAPDSDGDGATDVAELAAETPTDPNEPSGGSICGGGAEYGCAASGPLSQPKNGLVFGTILLALAASLRRRASLRGAAR